MPDPTGLRGYDLIAPEKLLAPAWTPLRHQGRPSAAEQIAARRAARERPERVARELAAAEEEWRQYFDRHYANRTARAAFDVHRPDAGYDTVVCSECEEHNGYEDTQQVAWPCRTYAAMKAAADA
jgi:hypothetical protein